MSDNKRHIAIIIFALAAILRCVVGIVYYAERIWGFADYSSFSVGSMQGK